MSIYVHSILQLQQEVMQWKTQTEIHEHSMVQLEADFAKINSVRGGDGWKLYAG